MINNRLALATCAAYPNGAADDRVLVPAFERLGIRSSFVVWDDPAVDWSAMSACLIRSTWGYHQHHAAFLAWAEQVEGPTLLIHDSEVLRWNTHKGYLLDLAAWGIPIVPTMMVSKDDPNPTPWHMDDLGSEVVIKPAVGASGHGVVRASLAAASMQGTVAELARTGDVLVQPFLDGVVTSGETSVFVIDGQVTHAICKTPRHGDFRVQEHLGGIERAADPSPYACELALRAVTAAGGGLGRDLLYARVDLLPSADGPVLAELEVTEPSLSFWVRPTAADRLAAAVASRMR